MKFLRIDPGPIIARGLFPAVRRIAPDDDATSYKMRTFY